LLLELALEGAYLALVVHELKKVRANMAADIVSLATYRASKVTGGGLEKLAILQRNLVAERRKYPRQGGCWADRRTEPRHAVDGKCTLAITLGGSRVAVENVSRNGLMTTSETPAKPVGRILIDIPGRPALSGRIIWKQNGFVGIEVPLDR